jgi:predicted CXXCH cytochrome family protein
MAVRHSSLATVALVLVSLLVVLLGLGDVLGGSGDEGTSRGVPMPDIPRGQGDSCIDDTEFMRRYHMAVLQYEHDGTPLKTIRGKTYSLEECIGCHTATGPDGRPMTADSPEHFCRSCHDYAAVKIDCFDCHRSYRRRAATRQR